MAEMKQTNTRQVERSVIGTANLVKLQQMVNEGRLDPKVFDKMFYKMIEHYEVLFPGNLKETPGDLLGYIKGCAGGEYEASLYIPIVAYMGYIATDEPRIVGLALTDLLEPSDNGKAHLFAGYAGVTEYARGPRAPSKDSIARIMLRETLITAKAHAAANPDAYEGGNLNGYWVFEMEKGSPAIASIAWLAGDSGFVPLIPGTVEALPYMQPSLVSLEENPDAKAVPLHLMMAKIENGKNVALVGPDGRPISESAGPIVVPGLGKDVRHAIGAVYDCYREAPYSESEANQAHIDELHESVKEAAGLVRNQPVASIWVFAGGKPPSEGRMR